MGLITMRGSKILGGLALLVILFAACEEIPPYINYQEDQFVGKDTTYILDVVPEKEDKNALIEDVSGVRCPNCPEANELAATIAENNPGRVVVITIHPESLKNLTFPIKDTFNTQDGERIFQDLIGGSPQGGLPIGAVNRKLYQPDETSIGISDKKWQKYTLDELNLKADVNLVAELISLDNNKVTIKATATFTETTVTPVYFTVAISESHIINPQVSTSGLEEEYEHNHVLRDVVTPYQGIKLADEVAEKGRVFERIMTFDLSNKYVADNCHIVLAINKLDVDNKEIMQVTQLDLN